MDSDGEYGGLDKIVDILELFDHAPPCQTAPNETHSEQYREDCRDRDRAEEGRDKAGHPMHSLQLEATNSLALGRHSIDNVLPIPRTMLSCSEDAFQSQDRQYQQKQANESRPPLMSQNEEELLDTLNLNELVPGDSPAENTKNVLRNFGNAQNHYALYNRRARAYLEANLTSVKQFDEWVRSLRLENFINFKKAWIGDNNRLFARVYKKLCWDFYTQNAIPYVLSSRIKKSHTRTSHLRYIFRFLEGLRDPKEFTYFRKS